MSTKKQKKKTLTYNPESLQQALKEIREAQIPVREANRKFGVPRSTIQDRISGRRTDELKKKGPEPVLGNPGENKIEEWLINIAKCGFPVKKQELLDTVQKILKDLKKPNPFKDDRPGQTWYLNFLKRHPKIVVRSAEGINKARARVTEESIRLWFRELQIYLEQEGYSDVLEDPKRIFNGDESGFSLCPKTGKVLGPKGYRNLYQIKAGNEKDNLTVLVTFNASGEMCPPLVVFPYIRPPKSVTDSMPQDWCLGRSESGWMNGDVFFEYITNDFNNWIIENEIKKPVLLLVDGHKSHMSLVLSSTCDELGIILYALPPNTTHMLQPADVSVFAPLKAQWKNHVRKFLAKPENLNKAVTKTNFCLLFKDIIENPQMKINIVNGFRRCGLFPFDPNAVDYTKCVQNTLEQFSQPTSLRENSGITNEDLIATRKVIRHLRPVLKEKKIDTKCILKEIKKLRRSEPREPQYITGSEDNTNSTLDVSNAPNLLSNNSAHIDIADANASNLTPPHVSDPNPPHVFDVTSANVIDLTSSHIQDPVPLTPLEVPDRTSESVPNNDLSNLVTSDFSGLELGTVVSLDDIVVIPFQTSTPKNQNLSPKPLVHNEISPSLKPDSNNLPLCMELKQIHQIQITDEPGSLETGTEIVSYSNPKEQLDSEICDIDSVTLSQVPTLKDNLPLCTVTTSENLSEDKNVVLTFGVTREQPEGRPLLSLDDVTVIPTISEQSDSHDVLSKKESSFTITSASAIDKISIDPNTVFEQHLFIPQPLEKSKQNVSKARIPSAISGKKWREYHLLKEKVKQEKNEEKENAKLARKQAAKRKQEEAKKKKEIHKVKKLKKRTLSKTKELASKQNIKHNISPKSLVSNEISPSSKPDSNNVPLCMELEQIHQIQITDEPRSLETGTELVLHSSPKEQLESENCDTDSVKLSQTKTSKVQLQMPTSNDDLPLCTVTTSENLSKDENENLTFGVTCEQPEGRSILSLDDVTVIPTILKQSDFHDVLSKKESSSTITSASAIDKISIDPNTVFEQHLFIPQPLEKSKQNVSKARIPSAISRKKWREYHLLKEKAKQEKNEEKENARVARKQAVKHKQEEAKKKKEIPKAKKLKKETLLKTKELASRQNIKQNCAKCANILNSDTEDDENKNVGCDFCTKWFHLKCTDFIGQTYDDVKDIPFKCNMCIIDKE